MDITNGPKQLGTIQTEVSHSFLSSGFNQLSSHWLQPQANIAPALHYTAQARPGTPGLQQSQVHGDSILA